MYDHGLLCFCHVYIFMQNFWSPTTKAKTPSQWTGTVNLHLSVQLTHCDWRYFASRISLIRLYFGNQNTSNCGYRKLNPNSQCSFTFSANLFGFGERCLTVPKTNAYLAHILKVPPAGQKQNKSNPPPPSQKKSNNQLLLGRPSFFLIFVLFSLQGRVCRRKVNKRLTLETTLKKNDI